MGIMERIEKGNIIPPQPSGYPDIFNPAPASGFEGTAEPISSGNFFAASCIDIGSRKTCAVRPRMRPEIFGRRSCWQAKGSQVERVSPREEWSKRYSGGVAFHDVAVINTSTTQESACVYI